MFLEAFYFGPSETYLFGVYHPRQNGNRNEGIVLCNPFGQEYMRAHRSLRRLAINLSAQGYSVLRFDYRGTGDSAGTMDSVSAFDWQEDIRHAVQELMDIAAVSKVALIGLRLGALLAADVAANNPKISRLVMWDPAISGDSYIKEIRGEITNANANRSRAKFIAEDGTLHFNGFCMPKTFQNTLLNLDLLSENNLTTASVAQIISHETQEFSALQGRFGAHQQFYFELAPAPHDWNYVDHVGGILWPQPILEAIESYFSK